MPQNRLTVSKTHRGIQLSKQKHGIVKTIETINHVLNELYALDSNWRTWGKWPETVSGSILHKAASNRDIKEAELQFGHEFPPSYKEFLRTHSGWEHFWGDFTLIGIGTPETQAAQDEIIENIKDQTSRLQRKLSGDFAEAVLTWESKEERNLYLANHLVIATDFSGKHWVYDTNSRRADGELRLVYWNISYGAQEPFFSTFYEFLDCALSEATARLEWTKKDVTDSGDDQDG
jgi:cell wall assembly regulator SMI1